MAAMGIDGLVSGLDTTSLITQLMQVEAMPQTLLKTKQTSTQSFLSGLQSLNTKVASLAEAAAKAAKPASWDAYKAVSSATSVTATTSAGAQPGTVSFHVDALAKAQVSVSDEVGQSTGITAVTIKKGATLVTVEPASGDLAAVTKAINDAADAGIKATAVRVGAEPPTYRLQLTGTSTGTAGAFEVYSGTAAEVTAGTATRLDTTVATTATNAAVTLWKGVAGLEETFSQSSNTFTGLMTGVDVTVSKVTAAGEDPVTLTVSQDDDALERLASGVVGALGVVLSDITSRTATTTKTNADGSTSVTGGLFSGDSAVRGIQQALTSAASMPVDGRSPSEVGIVIGRDGTFTFDEAKFSKALAADPARVQSMVTQVADRVAKAATGISDKTEGTLTLKITGQERAVKDIGAQIEGWDRRLELRRESLQRTYSALEVSLSNLNAQSSWLAGQLASLPTMSS